MILIGVGCESCIISHYLMIIFFIVGWNHVQRYLQMPLGDEDLSKKKTWVSRAFDGSWLQVRVALCWKIP